jgi:hypothetical protein
LDEDAAKTAVQLGHSNPTLLYNTYRHVVTVKGAKEYWDIVPKFITDQRIAESEVRKQRLGYDPDEVEKEFHEAIAECFED